MNKNLKDIGKIIEQYGKGKMIIVTDDDKRENEGDLMISSQCATAESIAFMARYGRGLICMPIEKKLAARLELSLMTSNNDSPFSTPFTVSVDAREGTTTGISAFDRLKTIETILNEDSTAIDLLRPGHLFPLIEAEGGLRIRQGHTEAAVEMGRLANHHPSGLICEIMSDDGTMMRGSELQNFSRKHNLPILTIEEIICFMKSLSVTEATNLPTEYGDFLLYHFDSDISDQMPHIALVHKEALRDNPVHLRLHSECLTGDVFGSIRCDCGNQLRESLKLLNETKGVLLYMRQEGRGIGLVNKMKAYRLQDEGADTVEANIQLGFSPDQRDYKAASAILKTLGISQIKLLTNNPAKVEGLETFGIKVRERIPLEVAFSRQCKSYLETKKHKMNHILSLKEVI